jgi:hypothetical protein
MSVARRETSANAKMGVTRESRVLLAGVAVGQAAVAAVFFGLFGPSEALFFVAGGALVMAILAGLTRDVQDSLYPAHVQLARYRRGEKPADVLVALPSGPPRARRRLARTARSVLRVTDGVAVLSSQPGAGVCAVLEPDEHARRAIEHRLNKVCGGEVRAGWASFPEDGVTLEALIAAATDRIRAPEWTPAKQPLPRLSPGDLAAPAPSLSPSHAQIGRRLERD